MKTNKFVTIGLVQSKVSANQQANLKKTIALVEKAAKKGAKIICLQELYKTIYFPQYTKSNKDFYAETIPGESTKTFCEIAKKYQVVIIVPVFEKNKQGEYFNSAAVINEKGKLLDTYRKIHIPQDPKFYEQNYFTAGSEYKVYKTKYASFAVLICYDQWFPEAVRSVALQDADIVFYPTAIGNMVGYKSLDGDWHAAWETVMRGHAIANSLHIAAVNRVGKEDALNFWGQSFICDSFGKILKRASKNKEEVLVCKIDLAHNKRIREGWGFFRNRRPDTYNQLVKK
jgi:agmatine deiminase